MRTNPKAKPSNSDPLGGKPFRGNVPCWQIPIRWLPGFDHPLPTSSLQNDLLILLGFFDKLAIFKLLGSPIAPRLVVHKPASWQVDNARAARAGGRIWPVHPGTKSRFRRNGLTFTKLNFLKGVRTTCLNLQSCAPWSQWFVSSLLQVVFWQHCNQPLSTVFSSHKLRLATSVGSLVTRG